MAPSDAEAPARIAAGPEAPADFDGVAFVSPMASRGQRLGAFLIDVVITVSITYVLATTLGIELAPASTEPRPPRGFSLVGYLINMVVMIGVNAVFIFRDGQTIGKMVVGIRVVRTNGDRVNGWRYILLRMLPILSCQAIGRAIPAVQFLTGLLVLADALLIFRPEANCLHDDLADTRVIRVNTLG